jgi:hypothetical protein
MIKLRLNWLLNLFWFNVTKITLAIVIFFSIYISNNYKFEKRYESLKYLKEVEVNGDWLYISKKIENSEEKYVINSFDKKQKVRGNIIYYEATNGWEILTFVILIISIISIIVIFIMNWINDYGPFGLDRVFQKTIEDNITCEIENDTYHYFILGRLIVKGNSSMRLSDIVYRLESKDINRISKIKTLPIYKTKTTTRNEKLEKILS